MGRWGRAVVLFNYAAIRSYPCLTNARCPLRNLQSLPTSIPTRHIFRFGSSFAAIASPSSAYADDFVSGSNDFAHQNPFEGRCDEEELGKIPVKAFFLCTSIDLRSMHAENLMNVVPPTSRSSNYIALRFYDNRLKVSGTEDKMRSCRYMVVFQYGSAVLFNVEDDEVESYLDVVRRHGSGFLPDIRKDEYAVKEKPLMVEDMDGGPDYIVLKILDADSIRIIGSVLSQSVALDYFVSQVDEMVEQFTDINREMESSGTFTMERKKLFQLVGKANSNLADVILKVGLFDRSEIAWRDAKYAQIFEHLREEYEVTQRFGNLNFKLKFVEHNIHFLQEALQNRKSDLLEWCIICLLSIENVLALYEIVRESAAGSL